MTSANDSCVNTAHSAGEFKGRIIQVITGSTGLDDWEWGVTLFGVHVDDLKECVYTMRYDEASTLYAEFGAFYTDSWARSTKSLTPRWPRTRWLASSQWNPFPRRRCCAGRVIGPASAELVSDSPTASTNVSASKSLEDRGRHQVGGGSGLRRCPRRDGYVAEWMKEVGKGVAGYQTPKVAVGAAVTNDRGETAPHPTSRLGRVAVPDGLVRRRLLRPRSRGERSDGRDGHRS